MRIEDQGLVLRRIPQGETSLVVHLFAREHGRLAFLARGVRRSKKGDRAALAGFHTIHFAGRLKEPGGLGVVSLVETVRPRHGLDLAPPLVAAAASALQEAVYRMLPEHDPHPHLFDGLTHFLDVLESGEAPPGEAAAWFQVELLREMGYGWEWRRCAGCGVEEELVFFSPKSGGLVCRDCGAPYARRLVAVSGAFTRAVVGVLSHLSMATLPPSGTLSGEAAGQLFAMGQACLVRHAGRALQAGEAFQSLLNRELRNAT